jgi:hypothetical protein
MDFYNVIIVVENSMKQHILDMFLIVRKKIKINKWNKNNRCKIKKRLFKSLNGIVSLFTMHSFLGGNYARSGQSGLNQDFQDFYMMRWRS